MLNSFADHFYAGVFVFQSRTHRCRTASMALLAALLLLYIFAHVALFEILPLRCSD